MKLFSKSCIVEGGFYAGIGSRKDTPEHILPIMSEIASTLEIMGMHLRSGGAEGADQAFESGIQNLDHCSIYAPYKRQSNKKHHIVFEGSLIEVQALDLSAQFHPYWHQLRRCDQLLMGRNCLQVLGDDLKSPAQFIICYTKNGRGGGGTGQALRIANSYNIPVFDMGNPDILLSLCQEFDIEYTTKPRHDLFSF